MPGTDNKEDEGITDSSLDEATDVTEDFEEEEETDDKVFQEDFTDASSTSGEDQGTSIIDEIFEEVQKLDELCRSSVNENGQFRYRDFLELILLR